MPTSLWKKQYGTRRFVIAYTVIMVLTTIVEAKFGYDAIYEVSDYSDRPDRLSRLSLHIGLQTIHVCVCLYWIQCAKAEYVPGLECAFSAMLIRTGGNYVHSLCTVTYESFILPRTVVNVIRISSWAVIFHVMEHPAFPGFTQCVTFDSFPTPVHERLYNLFCLLVLYGLPLSIIIVCYTRIFWEIHRQSRDPHIFVSVDEYCQQHQSVRGRMCLRRSDTRQIQRARNRTLRLTIIIVLAFFWCWTPYVTMVLWYQFDPDGAEHVNSYLQSSLFMFAVSNSCVNPLVYGSYTSKFRNCWARCLEGTPCPVSEHVLRQNANSIRRAPCTSLPDASKLQQNCSLCSDASVYPCEVTIRFKGHVCKNGSTSTRTMAPSCCCKKGSVDFMNGSHRRMTVPARCYAPEKRDVEDS
ncbi:neuropeptide SIFamide receptor-like isoform X3 [Ornithodoros turicata]|uniref:neuropeptide SIFamide receptor-like isoform X3 n=1 Tax=Ornithodoros turicata TaxID=34597 RepID=UPI003138A6A2